MASEDARKTLSAELEVPIQALALIMFFNTNSLGIELILFSHLTYHIG